MRSAPVRIVSKDDLLGGNPHPPEVRLADPKSFFAERAMRFAGLARDHVAADYLKFLQRLSLAQQAAMDVHPQAAPPEASRLALAREHGLPPLGKYEAPPPQWRAALRTILQELQKAGDPLPPALLQLTAASDADLDAMAASVLDFDYPGVETAAIPVLAAALQVHWLRRANDLGVNAFAKLDVPDACPVCGSPPLASTLRVDVNVPGTRYLHCALCASDWLVPRGQCTHCGEREKVAYFHIDGGSDTVKAEACDACRSYLKVVNMEKAPMADPAADDLATLGLDVLMDESGYERAGPNLFFIPGRT